MKNPARPEHEVLAELAQLCRKPGYVHAVAHFCFRDNVICYAGEMKKSDLTKMFEPSRLIRTEICTLLGLMIKAEIDWTLPAAKSVQKYMDSSERLLEELHHCMSGTFLSHLSKEAVESNKLNPFEFGAVLREPIFYSGEAAYNFQYLDLAARRYAADGKWLQANRGFTIDQASNVARAIETVHANHFNLTRERFREQHPDEWTMVPLFTFTTNEIVEIAGLPIDIVEKALRAFELPATERNTEFNTLHDFNAITATPLLRTPSGDFLSLQAYSLSQAIYDAPFYWMANDKTYFPTHAKNRGDFTEYFVADCLRRVFGSEHVHQNVDIFQTKAARVSDIDILVIWADRVIIVQAKSKRLTLEARKGNDQVIRDDFKKSIQAAYDQSAACATCLLNKSYIFVAQDGCEIALPQHIKEVYLFCVVSDHYPALSFQARQFLQVQVIDKVLPPLVMDIFAVDAMTEMLQSPLQFLSYANRRVNYDKQIMASQELTILGYHLTKNLWLEPNVHLMHLDDNFSTDLDIAMAVRRTGIEGADTPDGVLTRSGKTTIGRIVSRIEARPETATVDLGFLLLAMSEQAITEMSRVLDRLAARTRADGKVHDATFIFKEGPGITFHCGDDPLQLAGSRLESYCKLRKYREKSNEWFGLCLSSKDTEVRIGVSLSYPWTTDSSMEERTRDMQSPISIDQVIRAASKGRTRIAKIGRNNPCPCGSGLKYKKCCLN